MNGAAWILLTVLHAWGEAPPSTLANARAQELGVLRAEQRALEAALRSNEAASAAAAEALRGRVDALAQELAELQAENAARELRLPQREQARAHDAQHRHLGEMLEQMHAWLGQRGHGGMPHTEPGDLPALVGAIVAEVEHEGALHVGTERRFTTSGLAEDAPVLRVGRVAAVGWTDPPLPLIATSAGLEVAVGIAPHREPLAEGQLVRVVVHDEGDPPKPDAFVVPTWRARFEAGGSLMWVLAAFGVLAAILAVERIAFLLWAWARWRTLERRGDLRGARPEWLVAPLRACDSDDPAPVVEQRATQAVLLARQRIQRGLSLLSVVAAVAPLIGLLGTVSGMITTFSVVTTRGTDDPQLLAGGISVALLTTYLGLAVAIPSVIFHAVLSRAGRRLLVLIEQAVITRLDRGRDD